MINKYIEVVSYFFKLGVIAFGGPAAHIAMMQNDLVKNKKWMTEESFMDLIGLTSLIPGPNSTEMTMHSGYSRAGVGGLFLGGISFIIPAVCLTLLVAVFYENYHDLSYVTPFITGLKIAVLIIIGHAVYKLGRKCIKTNLHYVYAAIALGLYAFGINEVLLIFSMGLLGLIIHLASQYKSKPKDKLSIHAGLLTIPGFIFLAVKVAWHSVFFTFLKIGCVLFGSGYVLFAYLDGALVESMGVMTRSELIDAIAIGQFTPGPILSTATFIGYQLDGYYGAVAATTGIFLPSFFFVWLVYPLADKIRKSPVLSSFLDAVNVAALALMLGVSVKMGIELLIEWKTILAFFLVLGIYFKFKNLSSIYIVLSGAVLYCGLYYLVG